MTSLLVWPPFSRTFAILAAGILAASLLPGCGEKEQGAGAPPPAKVVTVSDMNLITIDNKDVAKFPLVTADRWKLLRNSRPPARFLLTSRAKFRSSRWPMAASSTSRHGSMTT